MPGSDQGVSRRRRAPILTLAVVLLASLLLQACGDDDGEEPGAAVEPGTDAEVLAAAADATYEADGPRAFESQLQVSGGLAGTLRYTTSGRVDPEANRGELSLDTGATGAQVRFSGDQIWIGEREDGEVREWLEADTADLEAAGFVDVSGTRPEVLLLKGAENIEPIPGGDDEQTDAYSFDIDIKKAVELAPDEAKAAVGQTVSVAGTGRVVPTGRATIDESGLVRTFEIEADDPRSGGKTRISIGIEQPIEPFEVSAPPADDVVADAPLDEFDALLKRVLGSGTAPNA